MQAPPPLIRILVIEDEQKLREALAEGFRLEGWRVVAAGSGMEALRHLAGDRFDLLILDWMLPDHDGVELLRKLRADGSRTPALIVSARFSHVDQGTAIQSGATDYIVKPFGFTDLLARCRALLAQTSSPRATGAGIGAGTTTRASPPPVPTTAAMRDRATPV